MERIGPHRAERAKLYQNPGHFSAEELVLSETAVRRALDNDPTADQWRVLSACIPHVQRVRRRLGPLRVLSGFRSREVNRAVKGSRRSDHMIEDDPLACAVDLWPLHATPAELALAVHAWVPFHRLIWEFGGRWVHVSLRTEDPAGLILDARRERNPETGRLRTKYRVLTGDELREIVHA